MTTPSCSTAATSFDAAFTELLSAYNERHDLRVSNADLGARAAAAGRHFRAQMDVRKVRRP